jgi:hypothetical protein
MSQNLTGRDFLKGTTVSALGVGTMALAGCESATGAVFHR